MPLGYNKTILKTLKWKDVEFCLLPYKIYGSWILPYTLVLNVQDILFLCLIFSYHNIEESQEHTPNSWTEHLIFAFWKVYTRRCSLHALGNHGNCDYIKGQTPPSKATMWEGLFFTFFKMVHALSPIVHPLPWKEIKKEKEKEVIGSFKWMSACTKWYIMEKMPTFMLSPNTINSLCFQDWSCPSCPLIYCWFNLTYNVTWYLILFECQYVWQQI